MRAWGSCESLSGEDRGIVRERGSDRDRAWVVREPKPGTDQKTIVFARQCSRVLTLPTECADDDGARKDADKFRHP